MAGGVRGERRREGGESSPPKMATFRNPGNASLAGFVSWTTHVLLAMTGLGYLALTWSTVVLLGGFVTALQRKDFWCLTVISMLQAARIFNDLGDELVAQFSSLLTIVTHNWVSQAREWLAFQTIFERQVPRTKLLPHWLRIVVVTVSSPALLLIAVCYIVVFLYGYGGPTVCIGLALWRIVQRDYGSNDEDVTKANLAPALDMFYGLILCQGVLYLLWFVGGAYNIVDFKRDFKLPREWGHIWLVDYYFDTRARCWKDSASIRGRTISHYAVDLIDSESWGDNRSGARMLATFIRQGADIRSLLLPSRPRVQKLIDTLGWRGMPVGSEMREAAASIVAHLAGDIHLSQFPGAIRCISTLLQDEATTQTYRWKSNQQHGRPQLHTGTGPRSTMHGLVRKFEKWMPKNPEEVRRQGEDDDDDAVQQMKHADDDHEKIGSCNEMILQGPKILERLASDHHNCMEICTSPGILPKIMAPLCSSTLIHGVKSTAWADVVNGSLKVLYTLMRCPGPTGTSLRREISANQQAISNLDSLLAQMRTEACQEDQELQMRAMEILTELALDVSIILTVEMKQSLMKKQLEIFLDKESASISKRLRATAGTTLEFLSVNSEVCSALVRDYFDHLTEILDAKENITYRIIAAKILENICAHCDLDKGRVKDALLPKVLKGILSTKREQPHSDEENKKKSTPVDDVENQNKCAPPGNDDQNHNVSAHVDKAEIQEISSRTDQNNSSDQGSDKQTATFVKKNKQTATNKLQESFLSLTLVIYDKLVSTTDFDDAVQKQGQGSAEFVVKLKTILEGNCKETPISLRIVKLCGQIAASMTCRKQYTEQFKNQGFAASFSEARKIMSNLESCILFAGTEFGQKKISMPFLSELEKKVKELTG